MKPSCVLIVVMLTLSASISAQSSGQATAAPTLVRIDGQLKTPTGEARTGNVAMVVSLYADKDDATPLWVEQQVVTLDAAGRYTLFAGATLPDGVPAEFLSGANAGHWLGVGVQGEAEQFRMMLVTVPYALKAREADTLGGKSLADFVLTESLSETAKASLKASGAGLPETASGNDATPSISSIAGTLLRDNGAGGISPTGSSIVDDGAGSLTVRPVSGVASKLRFWNAGSVNETFISDLGVGSASELVIAPGFIEKMRIKSSGGADLYGNFLIRPLAGVASSLRLWNGTSNSEVFFRDVGDSGASELVIEPSGVEKLRLRSTGTHDLYGNLQLRPVAGVAARFQLWNATSTNQSFITDVGGSGASAMAFQPGGVERMRVTATGNVGIGTSSPSSQLHVRGASPVRILGDTTTLSGTESVDFFARSSIFSSDLGGMRIQRQSPTGNIDTVLFAAKSGSSASEVMRITGNSDVGIGTSTPLAKLHVEGGSNIGVIGSSTSGHGVLGDSTSGEGVHGHSTSSYGVYGNSGSSWAGYFQGNVNVTGQVCATNVTCVSDIGLKQNVTPLSYGLREVLSLRPVRWQWKDPTTTQLTLGLVAQEVEPVLPELILRNVDMKGSLGLHYTGLVPIVIKAVQEQQDTITTLTAENVALKAQSDTVQQRNATLEARITALEQSLQRLLGPQ